MNEWPTAYNPKEIEEKLYNFWEKENFFQADPSSSKEPFSIVMPPPNVTGVLHMGHTLGDTLQDIVIRYKRMSGYEVLWVPGTDHAGIATQTMLEKHLIKTQNKRRQDYTREEFLELLWKWKEEKQDGILNQIRKLGCSCDWSRLRFTLDDQCSKAVKLVFKKMYDEGNIYRGDYLVNWDPVSQTALADDEVEWDEKDSSLWYFKYPVVGSQETITIATTRPETMLGDTAVAVSPNDPRYKKLVGKKILLPFVNREILIIEDNFVDKEFGTGAVKITPAHDFNDYEIGLRHNLAQINIMTPDGKINSICKEFEGMSMLEAREAVVKGMKQKGLLEKISPYKLRVGVSYRSKAVIEPYLSKQWFVKLSAYKDKLLQVVKEKQVKIIPAHWEDTYEHWISNLRDWCISRQLWWGHRIPIWYNKKDPTKLICYEKEGLPEEVQKNPHDWYQDEDVLDTWFSSGLWPFSTLGWPEKTPEMKKFYPTSLLITGHDIIFFWVARMIFMSEYVLDKEPFKETFLHGLIYGKSYWRMKDGLATYVSSQERKEYDLGKPTPSDVESKWEKMSKTKGNVIDPLELIDTYGTDAMRLALAASCTQLPQIDLDLRRFEEYKNFANKIWNGARFIFQNIDKDPKLTLEEIKEGLDFSLFTLEDTWILTKINKTLLSLKEYYQNYHFDKAAMHCYDFFWNDFCAYYLEIIKPTLFGKNFDEKTRKNKLKLLLILLGDIIRIFHPIAPFITEEIFQRMKNFFQDSSSNENADLYTKKTLLAFQRKACIVAPFPGLLSQDDIKEKEENDFIFIQEIVRKIRNIRSEMNVPLSLKTPIYIYGPKTSHQYQLTEKNQHILFALIKTDEIHCLCEKNKIPQTGSCAMIGDLIVTLTIPDELLSKEKERLLKTKSDLIAEKEKLQHQLSDQQFLEKAPAIVVEKIKNNLHAVDCKMKEIDKKLI